MESGFNGHSKRGRGFGTPVDAGAWTELDYLLHGDFCPAEEIQPAVEALREEAGGQAALLLVAASRGLLRTLCTYGSEDADEEPVRSFLRTGPKVVLRRKRALVTLPDDKTAHYPTDPRWLPQAVIKRIGDVATRKNRKEVVSALGAPQEWVGVRAPAEMDRMPFTVAVFVRKPASASLIDVDGQGMVECDDAMLRLGVMTTATANASVYRDTIITTRVDEKLSRPDSDDLDLQSATQDLVELAAEVTNSAAVGYYRMDPIDGVLRPIATYAKPERGVSFPQEIAADAPTGAAVAVKRRRPLAHGWDGPKASLQPTLTSDEGELPRYVEMATPVPGPLASPRVACAGALTALRLSDDGGYVNPFGAYDHSLLRNVALRLALLHATEDMEAAADMFRVLTIRESETASGSRKGSSVRREVPGGNYPIPEDVAMALPSIDDALDDVARLTESHSATFRVALPDRTSAACHGLSLVRVAAHSKDGLLDERPVQDVTKAGVNCQAVLTGSAQNVPFVSKEPRYDTVRGKTVSEISVPVTVEGMVIGVVNLESPIERNYDARISTAIAFAEHVGMVIADARLRLSRELHGYATRIVQRGHDMGEETKIIAKAVEGNPQEERARVEQAIDSIEARARGIRRFAPEAECRIPTDLPTLAEEARKDASVALIDSEIDPEQTGRPFSTATTQVVYECLRHVFVNVQEHNPIDAERLPRVELKGALWGGRLYQVLSVANQTKEDLDPDRAINFFRVPVIDQRKRSRSPGDGRIEVPRFGAYLAGNQARSIGGNVHMILDEPNEVRVMVMVPSPTGDLGDA